MGETRGCQDGSNREENTHDFNGNRSFHAKPWHGFCRLRGMLTWLSNWRRKKIEAEPFAAEHREVLAEQWSAWNYLAPQSQSRLENLVKVFLHEKEFEGCKGLKVTDAMKVLIAAQACMLILHRPEAVFALCDTVLVYPEKFTRVMKSVGPGGMVTETDVVVSGESWNGLWSNASGGPVVLSWADVVQGARGVDGRNVVYHEFAHQLDGLNGAMDGVPALGDKAAEMDFARAMKTEFSTLRQQMARGGPLPMHPYGGTNPAEFFAVGTEKYFVMAERGEREDSNWMRQMDRVYGVNELDVQA